MKNSLANVQARRADIERLVDRHGIATVKGLALRLKVSEITIRRDLKILHAMGRVKWHNGLVEAIAGQGGGEQRTLAVIAQKDCGGCSPLHCAVQHAFHERQFIVSASHQ